MVFIKNSKSMKPRNKLVAKLISISSDNVKGSFEREGKTYFKFLNLALVTKDKGEDKWFNITLWLDNEGNLIEEFPELNRADEIIKNKDTKPVVQLEYYETLKAVEQEDGSIKNYKNLRMNKYDLQNFKVIEVVQSEPKEIPKEETITITKQTAGCIAQTSEIQEEKVGA